MIISTEDAMIILLQECKHLLEQSDTMIILLQECEYLLEQADICITQPQVAHCNSLLDTMLKALTNYEYANEAQRLSFDNGAWHLESEDE